MRGRRHRLDFLTIDDQRRTLVTDIAAIRDCPLVVDETVLPGFVYDVASGRLEEVVPAE